MKKRVAVCMSGHSRTWKHCYENITNFLKHDDYEFDYFIHTWHVNEYSGIFEFENGKHSSVKIIHESNPEEYVNAYNPKLFKIQNQVTFQKRIDKFKKIEGNNTINLMYSFKQSILLKKLYERRNNFKYDFVIKLRPDVFFINQKFEDHVFLLKNKERSFLTYFWYEHDWKNNLDGNWAPDLYWMFNNTLDANLFANFFKEKILYEQKFNKIYTIYKHTYNNNLTPINLENQHTGKFPLNICRVYHLLLIDNFNVTFDDNIYKKLFYYDTFFNHTTQPSLQDRVTFLDLLRQYDKLNEFENMNFIDFFEKNKFIKDIMLNNLSKYL